MLMFPPLISLVVGWLYLIAKMVAQVIFKFDYGLRNFIENIRRVHESCQFSNA